MASTPRGGPLRFALGFFRDPRGVGAICPSSSALASAMCTEVELTDDDVVVEYGPGTGSFSALLNERLSATQRANYLGIERNETFCRHLQRRLPALHFVHGSATEVRQILDASRLPRPKFILSGLPLILMPADSMQQIVATAAEILQPGGRFRTFSYVHSWPMSATRRLRQLMRDHFATFTISAPVFRNIPPALILEGTTEL